MNNLGKMVLAGVMLASAATAQQWATKVGDNDSNYQRGYISGTTPLTNTKVQSFKNSFWSTCRAVTPVSVTYQFKDVDGNLLNSQGPLACDSTARHVVSFTAPLYFANLSVSPTTAVSTTTGGVSLTNVEARAIQ